MTNLAKKIKRYVVEQRRLERGLLAPLKCTTEGDSSKGASWKFIEVDKVEAGIPSVLEGTSMFLLGEALPVHLLLSLQRLEGDRVGLVAQPLLDGYRTAVLNNTWGMSPEKYQSHVSSNETVKEILNTLSEKAQSVFINPEAKGYSPDNPWLQKQAAFFAALKQFIGPGLEKALDSERTCHREVEELSYILGSEVYSEGNYSERSHFVRLLKNAQNSKWRLSVDTRNVNPDAKFFLKLDSQITRLENRIPNVVNGVDSPFSVRNQFNLHSSLNLREFLNLDTSSDEERDDIVVLSDRFKEQVTLIAAARVYQLELDQEIVLRLQKIIQGEGPSILPSPVDFETLGSLEGASVYLDLDDLKSEEFLAHLTQGKDGNNNYSRSIFDELESIDMEVTTEEGEIAPSILLLIGATLQRLFMFLSYAPEVRRFREVFGPNWQLSDKKHFIQAFMGQLNKILSGEEGVTKGLRYEDIQEVEEG